MTKAEDVLAAMVGWKCFCRGIPPWRFVSWWPWHRHTYEYFGSVRVCTSGHLWRNFLYGGCSRMEQWPITEDDANAPPEVITDTRQNYTFLRMRKR